MNKPFSVDSVFRIFAWMASVLLIFICFRLIRWLIELTDHIFRTTQPTHLYFIFGLTALVSLSFILAMVLLSIMITACYYERFPFLRRSNRVIRFYDFLMSLRMYRDVRLRYIYSFNAAVLGTVFSMFGTDSDIIHLIWAVGLPVIPLTMPLPNWSDTNFYAGLMGMMAVLCFSSIFPLMADPHYLLSAKSPFILGFIITIYPCYRIMKTIHRLSDIDYGGDFRIFRPFNFVMLITFCCILTATYFYPVLRAANIYLDRSAVRMIHGTIVAKQNFTLPTCSIEMNIDGESQNAIMPVYTKEYDRLKLGNYVEVQVHNGLLGWPWVKSIKPKDDTIPTE